MQLKLKLTNILDRMVDKIYGKNGNIVTLIFYIIIVSWAIYSILKIPNLINNPIITNTKPMLHGTMVLLSLSTFYISMLGDYFKEPSRRIFQYIVTVFNISLFAFNYLSETFNSMIIGILGNIKNIDTIPPELLIGNIRIATILVPASITIPMFFLSLSTLKDDKSKSKLREYEVEELLPTLHKSEDYTIDIELSKDLNTGKPIIVPEKVWFEHAWIQGGTGSGKSALMIIPMIEQLFDKKTYLQNKLKHITYKALESKIAQVKRPITNKWFNENFDLELIEPVRGKETEFYNAYKNYTIGVIGEEYIVYEGNTKTKLSTILKPLKNSDGKYDIEITASTNNMVNETYYLSIVKGKEVQLLENEYFKLITDIEEQKELKLEIEGYNLNDELDNDRNKTKVDSDKVKIKHYLSDIQPTIKLEIEAKNSQQEYNIKILYKGTGRIVPRNLGMTVVAPDGDLIKTTQDLANNYGVKIHRIDPIMEEIKKGGISKYNPLLGDSPEKIGDIVASILISMDVGSQSKVNPYFTNASVRAIRNITILLKVTYPSLYHREPTLDDVLNHLNNFDLVDEPIRYMQGNVQLMRRWKSVVDYINTSFKSPPKGNDGKPIPNSPIGSQRKKTEEAISGIINQLDNLLSREEIRYILCSNDSINLADVLRKGESIAISTRQGHLGPRLGRAFALFFILSLQNEVLNRYAENENPEIPHFLIIDEFPMYANETTETFFSFSRKYKCSTTIAIQNIGQLKRVSDEFGETIFTNTGTKVLLPGSNLEDRKYWSDFFGDTKELELMTGVATSTIFAENPSYSEQVRGTVTDKRIVSEEDIKDLNFHQLFYSYINKKGRRKVGKGTAEFVKIEKNRKTEFYDFEKYSISFDDYKKVKEVESRIKEHIQKKREVSNITKDNIANEYVKETDTQPERITKEKDSNTNKGKKAPKYTQSTTTILSEEITKEMFEDLDFEDIKDVPAKSENKEPPKDEKDESLEGLKTEEEELIKFINSEYMEDDI